MRKHIGSFLSALAVVWVFFTAPTASAQIQWRVGKNEPFQSIQEAINAAPLGTVIYVDSGTYSTHLTVDKPVTLVGIGNPVLDGEGQGNVVQVEASNVEIVGFNIRNSGSKLNESPAGILVSNSQNVTLQNNTFRNDEYGIYLKQSSACKIVNNKISGIQSLPVEDRGDGIRLWHSNNNLATGNQIEDVRDGMLFEFSSHNEMVQNKLTNLRYGLHYMYSNDNDFRGNIFKHDVAGATPMYSDNMTFENNVFMDMVGYRGYGILLKECNNNRVENNLVLGNAVGIYLDESFHNVITHNYIVKNGIGIRAMGSSGGNQIYLNDFIDNITQVGKITTGLPNEWSVSRKGNYWTGYVGYDPNHTGTGLNPYNSKDYFATVTSEFPTLLMFAGSPAVNALKSAENQFPLNQLAGITDSHPLMQPIPIPKEWDVYIGETTKQWPFTALLSVILVILGSLGLFQARLRNRRGRKWLLKLLKFDLSSIRNVFWKTFH